jgi:3-deoxy-D-manno-octulosonic-acid transferase
MESGAALAAGDQTTPRAKQIANLTALNLLCVVASPYMLLHKVVRTLKKKSRHELDPRRWFWKPLRSGENIAPKSGPRLVLVGPTFGEVKLMDAITRPLREARPDLNIIWCIRDFGTINLVRESNPEQAIVLWPFDNVIPMRKWAQFVKPDILIIVEKFWIPNLITVSKLSGSKVGVINARSNRKDRISDKFKRGYYRWVGSNIDLLCFQSTQFLEMTKHLYRPSTPKIVTGNMKLDLEVPKLDEARLKSIEDWLSLSTGAPFLAAGSTHIADEEFVLEAFKRIRETTRCRLLLAPRKLERIDDVLERVKAAGYSVSRRSTPSSSLTDVYVLDTLGELANAYQFAEAAYIGGSLKGTGHNVVEPVYWGKPVCYGPKRGHFEELQLLSESYAVGFRCFEVEDLVRTWTRALADTTFKNETRENAARMIADTRGTVGKTVQAVLQLIDA